MFKRKLTVEDGEPSTSKPKMNRSSSAGDSLAKPCPLPSVQHLQRLCSTQLEEENDGPSSPCDLQRYSQNIVLLKEQVDDTQRRVASLEGQLRQFNLLRGEIVRELQGQLETLGAKKHQMETLEKSFSEAKRKLEEQKTQQQEELMKKQLEEALQEQKRGFDEILSAKNRKVTKEEKAKAQKDEVVTQVTKVLQNELQCMICSELFIEAVNLNCSHSFCSYCINQWRKKKDECPICRQAIQFQSRCFALDNCIDRVVENLSLDMKTRRQTLITERKTGAEVRPINN